MFNRGYVYVLTSLKTNEVKVGYSHDWRKRLSNIRYQKRDKSIRLYDAIQSDAASLVEAITLTHLYEKQSAHGHGAYGGEWVSVSAGEAMQTVREAEHAWRGVAGGLIMKSFEGG